MNEVLSTLGVIILSVGAATTVLMIVRALIVSIITAGLVPPDQRPPTM